MEWNQQTRIRDEEYLSHNLPQSQAPLKYFLSGPRSGYQEFTKRTFHIVGDNGVDRGQLTNLNDLPDYNTALVKPNALKTRSIFGEEVEKETFLRMPDPNRKTPLDIPIDRFDINMRHVQYPVEPFTIGGTSTRADLKNDMLNA